MKVLTSLTIIVALPTLVASFYGMNVALPLQAARGAFVTTIGVSLAISLAVALLFRSKHWL
jgi:magnesium transporter